MKRAALTALAALSIGALACTGGHQIAGKRVIVLGFDGLDYGVTQELMARGSLPNFSRLAEMGGFTALGTSIPPQSPVAWSTFITGLDPGRHGIFDFVPRDPKTMQPYLSTTRTEPAARTLKFGKWQVAWVGFYSTDVSTPVPGYAKQSQFAMGGLLGYDFGPLVLQGWLTSDVYERSGHDIRGWTRIVLPLESVFGPPAPAPMVRR